MAGTITHESSASSRSFFCVGDIKQAIYGWRGGMTQIFATLQNSLGQLQEERLATSRRSAPPIIDVVNKVFSNLSQCDLDQKYLSGLNSWSERFEEHTTFKSDAPGYVCLSTGPAHDSENPGLHLKHVAARVRDLFAKAAGRTIGVLCRKNEVVARLIYELRKLEVDASEEGGNALDDSPAVELLLSLFTLADHPGHSIAWFHLQNSLLKEHLASFATADALSAHLRTALISDGYGQFAHTWATRIAAECDRRDLSRLQQLVESAYSYQARSTLRPADFVSWVRKKRVPDPSAAAVRVMTIHSAKGLEFDAVVLPELAASLAGQAPAFVVGRDPATLAPNFVCRYANEAVQRLLADSERLAFDQDRQMRVEESLSLLYVAMTRAIHALYLFIPGPRNGKFGGKLGWNNLLLQTLAPKATPQECTTLFEHGDPNWFQRLEAKPSAVPDTTPGAIKFHTEATQRRRGLEHLAPSRREGMGRINLDRLFTPAEGTGTAAGTLFHAWFETIAWLDDGPPSEAALRSVAQRLRSTLPAETWRNLDQLLHTFQKWLATPNIAAVLRRSTYSSPEQPEFPSALKSVWTPSLCPQKVECERPFIVRDAETYWNGSLDRVVWLGDKASGRIVAADVLDFKTDQIEPGNAQALLARTEHYRPQLEGYRRVVARMARLPEVRVAARLLFTYASQIQHV